MRFSPEKDDLTKNKPNLSQNKANSKPICRKGKIDAKCVYTKDYEEKFEYWPKKTNPKQTQFKTNYQSSLIDNQSGLPHLIFL